MGIGVRVIVRTDGDQPVSLEFPSLPITIGANHGNDLVLDHPWVSGEHAVLSFSRGALEIHDRSRNGCWVRGERITSSRLGEADRVRIPPFELEIALRGVPPPASGPARPPNAVRDGDLLPALRKAARQGAVGAAAAPTEEIEPLAPGTPDAPPRFGLSVETAPAGVPRAVHPLGQARVTIGRDAGADVRLPLSTISRFHASLEPSEGGWILEDLESANGVLVSDVRISRTTLAPGDAFALGRSIVLRIVPFSSAGDGTAPIPPSDDASILLPLRLAFLERGTGGRILSVHAAGRADAETAGTFLEALQPRIAAGAHHLVLVLEDLVFIDHAGLGALLQVDSELRDLGGRLVLAALSTKLRETFSLSRLDTVYRNRIFPDEASAIDALEHQLR